MIKSNGKLISDLKKLAYNAQSVLEITEPKALRSDYWDGFNNATLMFLNELSKILEIED